MLSTVLYVITALVMGALLGAFLAGRVWSLLVRASQQQAKEMGEVFDELKSTADKLLEQRNAEKVRANANELTIRHLEAKCREQQRTIDHLVATRVVPTAATGLGYNWKAACDRLHAENDKLSRRLDAREDKLQRLRRSRDRIATRLHIVKSWGGPPPTITEMQAVVREVIAQREDLIAVLLRIHNDPDHVGIFGLRNMATVALQRYHRLPYTTSPEAPATPT